MSIDRGARSGLVSHTVTALHDGELDIGSLALADDTQSSCPAGSQKIPQRLAPVNHVVRATVECRPEKKSVQRYSITENTRDYDSGNKFRSRIRPHVPSTMASTFWPGFALALRVLIVLQHDIGISRLLAV